MKKEWLTIKELADLCRLPESSARRYANRFSMFIPHKTFGRVTKYPPEAAAVLVRISDMFSSGMYSEEIAAQLGESEDVVIEVSAQPSPSVPPDPMLTAVQAQREAMAEIAATLQRVVEEQSRAMEEQRREIQELRNQLATVQEEGATRQEVERSLADLEGRLSRVESRKRQRWWWPF